MAVTSLDPLSYFHHNQSSLLVCTTKDLHKTIKSVIERNLQSQDAYVESLKITAITKPSLGKRFIHISCAIKNLFLSKSLHLAVCKIILYSSLLLGTWSLSVYILIKLATYLNGYDLDPSTSEALGISYTTLASLLIGFSWTISRDLYLPIIGETFQDVSSILANFLTEACAQDVEYVIQKDRSSLFNLDRSAVENDFNADFDFMDPLADETLGTLSIEKPRHIRIEDWVFDIVSIVKFLVSQDSLYLETLSHPISDERVLYEKDHKKLMQDVCQFFSCSGIDLKKMNHVSLTSRDKALFGNQSQACIKYLKFVYFHKHIAKNLEVFNLTELPELTHWKSRLSHAQRESLLALTDKI